MAVFLGEIHFLCTLRINLLLSIILIFYGFPTCDTQSTLCKFNVSTSTGESKLIDLTRLSRQKVWKVEAPERDGLGIRYIFLSMCGSLIRWDNNQCPDSAASVCVVTHNDGNWKSSIPNVGSILQTHHYNEKEMLIVNFINGQSCGDEGNYTTEIQFSCSGKEDSPQFVSLSCKLVLLWQTPSACPVEDVKILENCVYSKPPFTNLDLRPLWLPASYTAVAPGGRTFEVNVCGPIQSGHCKTTKNNERITACELDPLTNETKEVIGVSNKYLLTYSDIKGVHLTYTSGREGKSITVIEFVCNNSVTKENLVFKNQTQHVYTFIMESPAVCISWPVDCVTSDDQDRTYNLNSLQKNLSEGNWKVWDTRETHLDFQYHINVCGPLNPVQGSNCKGSNTAACQISSSNLSLSLGTLYSGPKVSTNGELTLHYKGGAPCMNGRYQRSTLIRFQCSSTEMGPVFDMETEDCVTTFQWSTPAACAIQYSRGQDCQLRDVSSGNFFDLRHLPERVHRSEDGSSYRVSLCSSLAEPCNGKSNVGVCLTKANVEFAIGFVNKRPEYTNGRIDFLLEGDQCKPGHNSSVRVIMLCDHEAFSDSEPKLISMDDKCNFYFVWSTNASCPPYNKVQCRVSDKFAQEYDLSPLSLPSTNYEVVEEGANRSKNVFIINVCRSVVFGYNSACEVDSGVCLKRISSGKAISFVNLGDVKEGPHFENDDLKIRYTNGVICKDANTNAPSTSTTITFACDPQLLDSTPTLITVDACHYEFLWKTAFACPINKTEEGILHNGTCVAENPISKYRFDLTSLGTKSYTVEGDTGHKFTLSVCEPITNSLCGNETGSCQFEIGNQTNHWSAGLVNARLQYHHGSLILDYEGGETCPGGIPRNTHLEFVCGPENAPEGPQFIEEIGLCSYIFHWNTALACEERISCTTSKDPSNKELNLSPLIRHSDNYHVTAGDMQFFINVCRPLLPMKGLSCPGGSAACIATKQPGDQLTHEMSLGYPRVAPISENGTVILKYWFGSPCPKHHGVNITSSFHFVCDHMAGQGTPEFEKLTHDCQYQFRWRTSVVCSSVDETLDSNHQNCTLYNKDKQMVLNLDSLYSNSTDKYYKVVKGNRSFVLNLCGDGAVCGGSALCEETGDSWLSYGNNRRVNFDSGNTILELSDGSVCLPELNTTYSAQVWFPCYPQTDVPPHIIAEAECSVVFEWGIRGMCETANTSASNSTRELPIEETHVNIGVVVTLVVLSVLVCFLLLYFRKAANRNRFKNRINAMRGKEHHRRFLYSRDSDTWSDL